MDLTWMFCGGCAFVSVRAINFATQRFISQIAYDAMQHAHSQISAAAAKNDPQVGQTFFQMCSGHFVSVFVIRCIRKFLISSATCFAIEHFIHIYKFYEHFLREGAFFL
jgi:hypothetical protein